jgi:dipeptidyl aminopeptidase/acylaminoacyl peptidase
MRVRSAVLATWLFALPLAGVVLAADPRPLQVDDLFALKDVGDPRLSPDGQWVAYTVTTLDAKKDTSDTDIYLVPTRGGEPIRLTSSEKPEHHPRFSPDGRWIAFLSGRAGKQAQAWLLNRAGGEAVKLTDYKASVSDLAWSPDSTRLALVVSDVDPDNPEPDEEATKSDDKKTAKPIVIDRLQFKRDGDGYLRHVRTHIHVVDVASKRSVQVTTGDFDDSDPAWSPDGKAIAFTSNRTLPDPDASQNTDIFVVPAEAGRVPRAVASSPRGESAPAFSPDGRWIAYVATGKPEDMWYGAGHVGVVPAAGGPARALTDALDRNVTAPRFAPDSRSVFFLLEDGGTQHVARVNLDSGAVDRIVTGDREVQAYDVGPKDEVVVLESTPARPAEISSFADGRLQALTKVNDDLLKGLRLGEVERFKARSADGTLVDGFLVLPPGYVRGAKVPAILRIHGGPAAQFAASFDFEWHVLAAQGYAVIAANPRGSTGYGTAFSRAIFADWGGPDFTDVMAAVDHVAAMGVADPERLGVGGWSYGGILTNYVISKTTRFKAAIAGAGIANVLAGYGTDHYQHEYEVELGLPWKARDLWVKLSSPYFDVEKIATPTLFLCGQLDVNVPLLATEQLYQAVRRVGKADTQLVIYPDQWHGIVTPSYRQDRYARYIAWYDRYLKPAGAARFGATPEATSLFGRPLYAPELTPDAKQAADAALAGAQADFVKNPDGADAMLWLGRRLAASGRVREAIDVFTRGVTRFPADARFLRHRGHRYVSVREFDKAIADLAKAGALIVGTPDQPEPSTADPAVASGETLHYAIWYHLGLAHYLKGEFDRAATAFRRCLDTATGSDERIVGATDWLYMSLRRQGRHNEAARLLDGITPDMKAGGSRVYLDRLLMYKGVFTPDDLLRAGGDPVSAATYGYAVGNWYLYSGQPARAREVFERVVKGPNWLPFGFIGAEAELVRSK